MMVSIDVGYGFTKAISELSHRAYFPSAASPRRAVGELSVSLGAGAPRHVVDLHRDGADGTEPWWVGEAALNAGAARTWTTEASARAGYDLLVLSAAALVGAEGQVDLALGLPLGIWIRGKSERRTLKNRLEGLGAWISVDGVPARRIEVRSVRVYPQSLGAYLAVVQGPDGWRLVGRPVGVIDIGYRTCDYLLITPREGAPAPDEERSGSIDLGIGQAYDAVREALASQTGGLAPPESLVEEAIAGSGTLHYRGSEIALRPLWNAACRKLAGEMEATIRRVWADRVDYLAAIVLAGGGAGAIREYVSLPTVFPAPEPVWANAVGFLTLLGAEKSKSVTGNV